MENVRLIAEGISSYVFTFVTKLKRMNKTLFKLRFSQCASALPFNCKVPDLNSTDVLGWPLEPKHIMRFYGDHQVGQDNAM